MLITDRRFLNLLGLRPTGDLGPLTGYTTKRGRGVWFLRAPPTTPPSERQRHCRNRFRLAAMAWRALDDDGRGAWLATQDRAGLNITGYNLWVYYQLTGDQGPIRTIERQTSLELLPGS